MRTVLVSYLLARLPGCLGAGVVVGLAFAGCTNDPLYIPGPMSLEAGIDMMGMRSQATASLPLPIKTETPEDQTARAQLSAELGVDVPYVRIGDLEVAVEWTITNLDNNPGEALIQLNGANEA